jgi:hypothetical protein
MITQYIYGIVDADVHVPGTDGLRLTRSGKIAAVHSEMESARLAGIEQDLSEDGQLAVLARRHDDVVRTLADAGTVLPVRLGTIVSGETALAAVLGEAESSLAVELDRIRGRHEWELRVRAGRPTTSLASSGTAYLMARRDEARAREGLRDALASVDATLRGFADAATGPEPAATGMSRSYLVPDAVAGQFAAAVAAAASELETRGCVARLSGPLPPYRFVAVRLEVGSLA